ncbi:LPXTG cell wall anchor domain-containing protein [Lactobacillus mulieris]|uniref:LPXTG cell wall anchor domain-containing protein n=1 Tax=Lactobacillus mulieris TaxID=2508708 RepID=A0AAW5WZA2_9LACO|nr:LPXTG cell wall anchor domain-containing protein [Lactobacillus mulieris]MCZ3690213.1 LPXTG cell wall anchor domain-containing protein [Lactobacillus mulieris]MCZ3696052.1 LPXTG cell wall anchor domain-containing protein [Lactobacillus mulieris]MCZ3702264.1 LPXTG cell wall anchor domain-containing protein [Lactobacillus mulieris]MCZ3703855.1 LPXTG cell wall anchor domain-containing protein [Lactobacillus mulieris]MCZ3705475.1 LPXTG cell wall anchor domain-containing protein [Lactobacillus m
MTRTITFDAVTGAIKSTGAWTTGTWNLVGYAQAPATIDYNGITYNRVVTSTSSNPAEQGEGGLQKETVTSDSKSYDVHVTYVANTTSLNFKAVDDDNSGATIPVTGITTSISHQAGQAVDSTQVQTIEQAIINKVQGLGYTFVPETDTSNPNEYVLHFKHTTLTLTDQGSAPKGITVDPLNKVIYRTISYKFGEDNIAGLDYSTNESYILKRTATIDLATKKVTYTKWQLVNPDGTTSTTLSMPFEAIPTAPTGYVFDKIDGHDGTDGQPAWTAIPSMNIDSSLIDSPNPTKISLTVRYKVATTTVPVYIYDVDSATPSVAIGKTETTTVDGKQVTQPVAKTEVTAGIRYSHTYDRNFLNDNVKDGANYEYITGDSYSVDFTMGPDGIPKAINLYVRHKHATKQVTTTSTRTIHIQGQDTPQTQTVTFTRNEYIDLVTNKVTGYSDWQAQDSSKASWDAVNVSSSTAGYTTYIDGVKGNMVAEETPLPNQNVDVNVTYEANPATVNIVYRRNDNNQVVTTVPVAGKVDQTVDLTYTAPAGYKITDGQNLQPNIKLKAQNSDITVYVDDDPQTYNPGNVPSDVPESIKAQMTKTVTRHIEIVYPEGYTGDKVATPIDQSVTFERDVTVDITKSGADRYSLGNWHVKGDTATSGSWASVELTKINGYHTDQGIDAATVDANTDNVNLTIHYLANDAQLGIKAVDDTDNSDITSKISQAIANITGKTGEAVDAAKVNAAVKSAKDQLAKLGYTYVGTDVVTKFDDVDDTAKPSQDLVIHFTHATSTYNRGDQDLPKSVDTSQLSKSVTRKIIVHTPDGNASTITQTTSFGRTVTVDNVTGTITYGKWTPTDGEFDQYDIPQLEGYSTTVQYSGQEAAEAESVASASAVDSQGNPVDGNQVDVYYNAKDGSQVIKYQDEGGHDKGSQTLTGKTGDVVKVDQTKVPAGYEVVPGTPNPGTVTIPGKPSDPIIIKVQPKIDVITLDNTKKPDAVKDADLTKVVTRVINVYKPGATTPETTTQKVVFTRTANYNEATGMVDSYSAWVPVSGNKFSEFNAPTVTGYIPDKNAPEVEVDADQTYPDVDIHYTAVKNLTAHIIYVDDDNNQTPVKVDSVTGLGAGDTHEYTATAPAGYDLANGQAATVTITVPTDGTAPSDTIIHLTQHTDQIKGGSDDTSDKTYDLKRTVTRHVYVKTPDGQTKFVKDQVATFTRDVTVNRATGKLTYTDWTSSDKNFEAVSSDDIDGYTQNPVSAITVDENYGEQTAYITYSPKASSIRYQAVDDDASGKDITPSGINLTVNTAKGIDQTTIDQDKASVEAAIKGALGNKYKFDRQTTDGNVITLHFKHATTTYGSDSTKPSVVKGALEADVTRPITIVSPDGTKQTIVQTVHLTRTATVDEETGTVTYGNWTSGQFKVYPVSDVEGYTTEVKYGDSAEATRVDGDVKASDITITGQDADAKPENGEPVIVTYKLNVASGKISYQTSDGTEVGSQAISGKAGETDTYKTTIPTGYELTDPNQTAVTVTYPTDGSQKTVVVTVQPKNDSYNGNGDKPDWVKDATNKDVTRTIHFAYPETYTGTKHEDVVQTVHFVRTATKNEATGDVTYGDWTVQGSDQFDAYNAPDIHGYHPTSSADLVTGVKADGTYDDVTITYAPDNLVGRVIYKYTDKNGNVSVVGVQNVSGTTDDTYQVTEDNVEIPKGYTLVKDQTLPSLTFKPGETNEVTVNVEHATAHFNPGDDIDSHKDDMPKGTDIDKIKQGMTKTVTRTVYVTPVNGTRHQVDTQTAHFKRGVTIDLATGEVTYDPWTSDDATFSDVSSKIDAAPAGYSIVSTHTYGEETVTANDSDIDVEVTYAAAKSHITIVAKDKTDGSTITIPDTVSTTLEGQTAATVDPKNVQTYVDAISKALESAGYQFDSTDTFPTAFNGDTTLNIYFTHRTDDKTTDLPEGSEDVTKPVTRTIHVIAPDGQNYDIIQTVTATRQAKVDAVTHKVIGYTDWTTPELTSVTAPQYAGYTPSIASVESHTPTADEINVGHTDDVTITYTGVQTSQSYQYIDADTGSQVGQTYQGANGKVVDKVNFDTEITTNIPNGYELLPGQTLPGEHELGQTNQTIKVYVRKTVVDDTHKTSTTPKGSDKSTLKELAKTIIRTVIAHVPGKDAQPIASQEVHFTRTATWNDATKSWDYSDWKVDGSQVWDAINDKDIPEVAGYTHDPVHVDSYNVLPTTKDQTVDINYTATSHTTRVIYKYGDLTVNTKELTGNTGDSVQTNINDGIPENYTLVDGQDLPSSITFDADGHADIIVNLKHGEDKYDGTGEKPAWATEDTTRTVTRTINVTYPEGKKPEGAEDTHTDSASFTRTATRDKVTGQVTYSAWTLASGDANFKKFTAPEVANYTPSTSEIAAETITADSPDTNYTITYNANGTNFTIKASDVTGDTPVDIQIPTGINPVITHKSDGSDNDEFSAKKAGVIAEIKQALAEKGYDFVGEDGNDTGLTLKFKHHENTYHQGDDIPEGDKDLIKEDLTKNVTRKVITTKPDGTKSEITQTVTATRTVTIDEATKTVTYGDWSLPSFEGAGVEQIKGYTSQVDGVNATTVASHQVTTDEITKGTASDVNVTYQANDHSMHIIYRDVDDGYKLVGDPITVTGKTNTTVDTNANVPAVYELVDGQTNPATVSFPADGSEVQDITVLVKHHVEDVDPNKPTNIPAGGDKDAIIKAGNKDVVRTIHYQKADGTKVFDDTTQTVHFTRIVKVDAITGKIVGYGDWNKSDPQPEGASDNWSSVTAQALAGYTPSQDSVQDQSVDADTNDKEITVVYTADTHKAHIIYQDGDNNNKTIYSQTVYGQTDKTYAITQDAASTDSSAIVTSVPAGYELADGHSIPTSISFDATGAKDIVIVLKHKTVDANTPDDVDTHKGDLPEGTNISAIKEGMAKDVTRTVYETKPGEARTQIAKQVVHFTRTASIDVVTGKVTYGAWTVNGPDKWDAVTTATPEGYEQVVTGGTLAETKVTGDTTDQVVEVTYTSQAAQDITIVAHDVTDKTNPVDLDQTHTLKGNVDNPVTGKDLTDAIEAIRKALVAKGYNYQGVEGEIPVKFDNSKHTIVLDFTRGNEDVPAGTTIPDKYKGIISDSDVTKTYTRTINLHYNVNGQPVVETVTQPVTLTRTAHVDLAKFNADPTDKSAVSYGEWTSADYPEYTVPAKAGYTPSQTTVAKAPATQDENVDVTYTGNPASQIFRYIDSATDKQVGDDVVKSGNVGDAEQTYNYEVPTGYKLAKGQPTSSSFSFTSDNKPINIYLDHDVQEVTPTNIPDGSHVTKADLEKTITRTISYKFDSADGQEAHEADVQTITLTRTAYEDPITHVVTYSNWATDKSFGDVTAPEIAGYDASSTIIKGHSVNGDSDDENITVIYTKKTQTTTIQYVDDSGKVIKSVPVSGQTGDSDKTINTGDNIPEGWKLDSNAPKTIDVSFGPDHPQTQTVKIVHDTKTYKSGDENAPEGLDKTVTRTINFHKPAGNEQVVQSVHYTRTATIDLVSGRVTYNEWTIDSVTGATKGEGTTASFDAISDIPQVDGYKADHTQIDQLAVTPDTADSVVDVYYNANKTELHFKAVDEDDNNKEIDLLGSLTSPINIDVTTMDADSQVASREADIKQYLADKYNFDTVETSQDGNVTTYILKFQHAKDTISEGGNLPEGVSQSDFTTTVHRLIKLYKPGQTEPEVIDQTITAHRQLTVDKADGSYKWTPWVVDSQFEAYNVPQIAGYTSSQTSVASAAVVQASDNDKTPQNADPVEIRYTAQVASQKVIYVDSVSGQEVSSFIASGDGYVTDANVDFDDQIRNNKPENYDFVNENEFPGSHKLTVGENTPVRILVRQHVDKFDSKNNPKNLELTKDVTRTIIVNKPGQKPKTITQTVHFTRTASVNTATNETTYSDWSIEGSNTWDAYQADDVAGYTTYVDGKQGKDVASQEVTAYTGNPTVNITYTANKQSVDIVYVDKNGNEVGRQTVNGHTGSTEDVSPLLPSGYHLADDQTVPSTVIFPSDGSRKDPIKVTVEMDEHTYNPGDKDLDTKVSAEVKKGMFHTVTRTINVYVPNEKGQEVKTTIVQQVQFGRTARVYSDGTVEYGDWTPQGDTKFDAINVDNFRGYDASVNGTTPSEQVAEVDNITAETADTTIDVHYLAQDQKVRFKVVDITDNKEITDLDITNDLEGPVITGKSGTEIPTDKVKAYVDQIKQLMQARGYEFDSAIYPSDFDKDKSVDQQVILNFRHAKKNFEGTDDIPSDIKKSDGSALTKLDLTRDVTRKITLHTPNGDVVFTQHVTAHRTATVDEVTHVATLGDWTAPDFASQDIPSYSGYTAKISDTTVTSVPSAQVAYANDEPQNASDVVVDYVGQEGSTQIDFVDKAGHVIGSSKSFTGQVGHDVTISDVTVPDGWKLAEGSTIPTTATVYADGRHVQILVVHDTENVPSTNIPDGTTKDDGTPLTEADLTNTVTRTITMNKPTGKQVIVQKVSYARQAIVDKVTHQVTGYTDWTITTASETTATDGNTTTQTGPNWKAISADDINVAGYTPTVDQVSEVVPSPTGENSAITINYVAQPAYASVVYHDDVSGKDVGFATVIGKQDGSKTTYEYQVPTGYELADKDKTSSEFSFDGNDHYVVDGGQATDTTTPFLIHVTHKTEQLDKDNRGGLEEHDFERTIERHVRIHIPEHLEDSSALGSFLQPGQTFEVVQSVTYERTATRDDATGKITFNDWTLADTSGNVTENENGSVDFKAVEAGELAGYTPITSAPEISAVTADSRVSDLDIYYVENGATITISAHDNDANTDLAIPDELQTTLTFPEVTGKDQAQKSLQSDVTAITAYFDKMGYDYVDIKVDGNHYTINFKHRTETYTGDTCPDIPSDLASAVKEPLSADVTRDIEIHLPGQTSPVTITQTVHAHRSVTIDRAKLAKGDADAVNYTPWVFDDGDKFESQNVAVQGYKAKINNVVSTDNTVPEASAKDKDGNPVNGAKVVVTYEADVASAQIHYIDTDDGNKEIPGSVQDVAGKSDEQKTVDTNLPDGYEYVDPSQKQVTIKFSDDGSVVSVNVLLKHKKVTTDDPTKLPINIAKSDGTKLTDADLTKTVTRTIKFKYPEGYTGTKQDTITQDVAYKRSVTYDPVTKKVVSFGIWTGTGNWDEASVKEVKGYTSYVDGSQAITVDKVENPTENTTVQVEFKAGTQHVHFIAIDDKTGMTIDIPFNDNNPELATDIQGVTGGIVDKKQAQSYIEAIVGRLTAMGWIYDGHGQVPYVFDDDESRDQLVAINFHAQINEFKPDDKLPNGAKDPNNKDGQIVREMIKTRTIIFKDANDKVIKTVKQTVDFVRDVYINKVTNQVDHYGDWQYRDPNNKSWSQVDVSKSGYTVKITDVTNDKVIVGNVVMESDVIKPTDQNSIIEVEYTKLPESVVPSEQLSFNTEKKGKLTAGRSNKTAKQFPSRIVKTGKLPQTGSDKDAAAALGIATLGLSSALGYVSKRKKRRN